MASVLSFVASYQAGDTVFIFSIFFVTWRRYNFALWSQWKIQFAGLSESYQAMFLTHLFTLLKNVASVKYEAYSESKYRLQIFRPQRWGRNFAHARCLLSFTGKPQTPIREKQMVFMYCSVSSKCSRWSSAPPTVKYDLLSVFECKICEAVWY
jgi:hypothetical protein